MGRIYSEVSLEIVQLVLKYFMCITAVRFNVKNIFFTGEYPGFSRNKNLSGRD